jgi:hypothetical protein
MAHEGLTSPPSSSTARPSIAIALESVIEELEAIDWYDQRVQATKDPDVASILALAATTRRSTPRWRSNGFAARSGSTPSCASTCSRRPDRVGRGQRCTESAPEPWDRVGDRQPPDRVMSDHLLPARTHLGRRGRPSRTTSPRSSRRNSRPGSWSTSPDRAVGTSSVKLGRARPIAEPGSGLTALQRVDAAGRAAPSSRCRVVSSRTPTAAPGPDLSALDEAAACWRREPCRLPRLCRRQHPRARRGRDARFDLARERPQPVPRRDRARGRRPARGRDRWTVRSRDRAGDLHRDRRIDRARRLPAVRTPASDPRGAGRVGSRDRLRCGPEPTR